MLEEFQEQQRKRLIRTRSIMDWTMGIIFFLAGIFFLVYQHIGIRIMDREPGTTDYLIGGLFVLYGIWRIYRGYKKDYLK